jgi:GT2 family glycosyltransferase
MAPTASVIIPHHNAEDSLRLCLASLTTCQASAEVEIIVIDNGIPALSAEITKDHPDILFFYDPHAGAAHARNIGVEYAKGDILIFTDCDCQVAPDFLTKALEIGAKYNISGGAVRLTSQGITQPNGIQAFEHVFAFNQRRYIKEKGFSVTANLVTNIAVFKRVGPFRAAVSEDLDWGQRATALGYEIVFQPDLIVDHPCRSSWSELRSKWKRITVETYGVHRSHGQPNTLWIARALMMPISIIAHAPKIIWSSALNSPRERIGALYVLARLRMWRMVEMIRLTTRHDPAESG